MTAARRELSDWIHPVLIRDVRRSMRSKVHGWTLFASCVAVGAIALAAADRQLAGEELARFTVLATLRTLAPVVLFAIPLQAFLTLREEVAETTADQLLLAGMRPNGVIAGMLVTAVLQSITMTAVFAPLLAFCYPLLGVDLHTLLQILWLAPLSCAVATAAGFATLRLGQVRALRGNVGMVALALLGGLALWAVTGADSLLETLERHARSRDFWLLAQQQWTVGALLVISLGLVGAGALTHIRETAAVSFRVLGLAAAPTLTMFFGAGTIGATQATFATFPFWFIATTSPLPLQRREIALVPNNPRSALRHAPILPGCGRGIVYTLTMAVILVAFGLATHVPFHGALPSADELLHLSAAVGLMCAWGAGIAIRRMRAYEQSRTTTSEARARIPALLFFAIFMGAMFDGIFAYNTKIGVFLVSTFNPVVLLAQPDVLLPLPLVNVMVWFAALMLLWSARDLIAFSFAELRNPGRVPVPKRYRGAGGATGDDSGARRRRRVPLSQRRR